MLLALIGVVLAPLFLKPSITPTEANTRLEEPPSPPQPEIHREIFKKEIAPGDTFSSLFDDFFTPQQIYQVNQQSKPIFSLSKLSAGQPYRLFLEDGRFARFEYDIDRDEQLIISHHEEGFTVTKEAIEYQTTVEQIEGVIDSSLFNAVAEIGESDSLAMSLADIFAWDIDFILDIRQGASFQALVEKRFRDGQPAGNGRILAARFVNQGTPFEAILYQDEGRSPDYYDASGASLRKAFLKAPLEFSRISSGFTLRRFHPITKTWKAHPAIDYAAPRGTPIKSVGDGTIIKKGYTRGNGNYVKIRHNGSYETIYLHMSRFAKGVRQGSRVNQGQVVGYVGSTGLATGPHLCFRMYKNGSPVNPHKVKAPSAAPISPASRETFALQASNLLRQLGNTPTLTARQESATQTVSN
ncbi:MAG: peptidase M23 [Desulfuromonas sp.]|nr:MAG: peptidase M23 [Desulfuromonas sp.]